MHVDVCHADPLHHVVSVLGGGMEGLYGTSEDNVGFSERRDLGYLGSPIAPLSLNDHSPFSFPLIFSSRRAPIAMRISPPLSPSVSSNFAFCPYQSPLGLGEAVQHVGVASVGEGWVWARDQRPNDRRNTWQSGSQTPRLLRHAKLTSCKSEVI